MGLFIKKENDEIINKSKALFETLNSNKLFAILERDNLIVKQFEDKYKKFNDKMFYSVIINCGGIIFDNWIRFYGSGILNIIEKNNIIDNNDMDIVIGEDIIGGLFGIKENMIYYFAPDSLRWESLDIGYVQLMTWLINTPEKVNQFYENNRWENWKQDVKNLKIDEGIFIYPYLFTEENISVNERSRRNVSMMEIIEMNKEFTKQLK